MVNEFKNVIEFNNQVIGLTCVDFLSKERLEWFKGVINEELGEFEEANNNYIEAKGSHDDYMARECKAEMADAIIDLIYFAYGRLYEIGIFPEDFKQMWEQVHAANMKKKKGNKGRGSDLDAVKPEGWEAPEKKFFTSTLPVDGEVVEHTLSPRLREHSEISNELFEPSFPLLEKFTEAREGLKSRLGTELICDMNTLAAMPKAFIEATQLCMKKSQDYNNGSNKPASRAEYFPFGALSYAQMLHTKTQRLNSLVQQTKKPNNESIRDTLLDLINYSGFAVEAIDKGEI